MSFTIMNSFTKKYLSSQAVTPVQTVMPSIGDLVQGKEMALLWDIQAPEEDYYR